jgi:hypothetical protein
MMEAEKAVALEDELNPIAVRLAKSFPTRTRKEEQ